ncbi:MAG: hypothetical protein K0Q53_106 [Massilibacillus sp.]|nr:hypothetical protein [Massilibacillus sp.]
MSDNKINYYSFKYEDKDSLFTYVIVTLEKDILYFDLFKHKGDKQLSKTLKFNYEYFKHKFKNGYCQHCMFKFGEILPQSIKECYVGGNVYPVRVYKTCPHNHVIG